MTPPSQIAHYRITSKLGEGGMGAVYRATDTKLNRDVAIKILPPAFAEDADRMARFTREAQVLASLNHPNIAAIYGIEAGAIVMELVDGSDLSGPLPIPTVLDYARQIAAGLEAAHEKGIVHRDLKPANIKLTSDGTIKLLDFGLAKATEQSSVAATAVSPTLSPTLSLAMTQAGMILGTAAYMSPEQARGKPVDRRADIWAYGVILFELLTGTHLYGGGETVTDTLAAVVLKEPDFATLPEATPPRLRRLIERCLRKDPKLRLRDIGEARIALDEPEPIATPAPLAAAAPRRSWIPWTAAALALLAAGAAILLRPATTAPVRFSIVPGRAPVATLAPSPPALAPDGRQIAYISESNQGRRQIFIRPFDEMEARPLPATQGVNTFGWSPDSRQMAYLADNKLNVIDVKTGAIRPLATGISTARIAWGSRGILLINSPGAGPLLQVRESGGQPSPATTLDASLGELDQSVASFCPDGLHFLYSSLQRGAQWSLRLASIDQGSKPVTLGSMAAAACTAIPGILGSTTYLIDLAPGSVGARTLDVATGALGESRSVLAPVSAVVGASQPGSVSSSAGGSLAFSSGAQRDGSLVWYDRAGRKLDELPANSSATSPALSPDEKFVVASRSSRFGSDLWITDLSRKAPLRLQVDKRIAALPVWAPDGSHIAFACDDGLCEAPAQGGSVRVLSQTRVWPQQYSSDGRYVLCVNIARLSLELIPVKPGDPPVEIAPPGPTYFPASISPDGRFVTYTSAESGRPEIYVRAMPPAADKWSISTTGGGMSFWRADGKELFYLSSDLTLMALDVRLAPTFQPGTPHALFKMDTVGITSGRNSYVASHDGSRFLAYTPAPEYLTDPVYVILRWPALLGKEITAAR